jgi:nicotinamide mononucleotide transporter
MLDLLDSRALTALGTDLTWGEVLGFATGAWCLWLSTRKSIWTFPLLYVALGVHGWVRWADRQAQENHLPITRATSRDWRFGMSCGAMLTVLLTILLMRVRGSVPALDALITSFSLVAQYWFNRRLLENWHLWIVVGLICIPVYVSRGLYLIALLYCGTLVLCLLGLRRWQRELADGNSSRLEFLTDVSHHGGAPWPRFATRKLPFWRRTASSNPN